MLDQIKSLIYSLPDDIQLAKGCGDFETETRLIHYYLNDTHTPQFLKKRLLIELEIIKRLPYDYPYTKQQALALVQQEIPDFTMQELMDKADCGAADWIYIDGEVHFQRRFFASIKKVYANIAKRAGQPLKDNEFLNEFIKDIKANGQAKYHIHIKHSVQINDDIFHPGEVLVHIPVPTQCESMQNIHIISHSENGFIDKQDSLSRTISFKENMRENHPFYVEYEYDSVQQYHDVFNKPQHPLTSNEDHSFYLKELYPQIVFTPMVKALCQELSQGKNTPLEKAYAFYKYACENVTYSFMRSYFTNTNIVEYALAHRIGDCGVKALLFITLCRCAGIPAHWQSGLYVKPSDVGNHDWAMFYIEGYGWLYADPSFGGSAYRLGNTEREDYYFANLDCFRMTANNEFQQEFNPAKTCYRSDPYDNQSGEIEYLNDQGLLHRQFKTTYQLIEFKKL